VVDKNSFEIAETILKNLREHEMMRSRPAILVGNKVDMARSREVSAQGIWFLKKNFGMLGVDNLIR
jgi:GTPase SAR1 family protein